MFPVRTLKYSVTAVFLTVVMIASAAAADAPFWPQFHGPNCDNISTDTGLLKKWPEGGPKLLWTAQDIGHGYASVSIADGLIYTAGNIDEKTVITAMDLDGKIQWQVANGPAWDSPVGGSRGTPTIDGDRLYHESPHGDVACFEAKTGNKVWAVNIIKEFGAENNRWGLAESLLVDGDHVLCRPGGPETCVAALDKQTGELVWKSPAADGDLAGYGSMLVAELDGLRMVLTLTAKAMIGVHADTGDLLWRFPHTTPYDENIIRPIFHDGRIYFSTGFSRGSVMLKVTVDGQKASVEEVWRNKDLDNHHGGVLLLDGYLYGSCYRKDWACLDWATGKTMYRQEGIGKGSLTAAEGMLYTLSEKNRTMGLVQATPDGHKVISQFEFPEGGQGPSWAHPVVCGGRLYIRHGRYLYVYDVKAE